MALSRLRRIALAMVSAVAVGLTGGCSGLARTDGQLFPPPARDAVTFWGHACCYIDVRGVGVVTDPVFRKTLVFRHRRIGAPPPSSYAGARVVLISHAHPDHLDVPTLRTFPEDVTILCPAPSEHYLRDVGREVRVMRPGDTFSFDGGTIVAVAAHHMGTRWGIHGASDGRALGYVVRTPGATIYYSGDSNFFSGFADVGWTYDPDIALLNVNGHLRSTDAVRAAWATRARVVIPLHWGAYPYWIFGGNSRPRDEDTLARLIGDRLHVLSVGQSFALSDAPHARPALP